VISRGGFVTTVEYLAAVWALDNLTALAQLSHLASHGARPLERQTENQGGVVYYLCTEPLRRRQAVQPAGRFVLLESPNCGGTPQPDPHHEVRDHHFSRLIGWTKLWNLRTAPAHHAAGRNKYAVKNVEDLVRTARVCVGCGTPKNEGLNPLSVQRLQTVEHIPTTCLMKTSAVRQQTDTWRSSSWLVFPHRICRLRSLLQIPGWRTSKDEQHGLEGEPSRQYPWLLNIALPHFMHAGRESHDGSWRTWHIKLLSYLV